MFVNSGTEAKRPLWGVVVGNMASKWESFENPALITPYCSSFHSWNQKNPHITFLFNLKHVSNNSLGPILPACFQWWMYPIWRDKTSAVGDRDYLQFEAMGLGLRWDLQSGLPHDSCWIGYFHISSLFISIFHVRYVGKSVVPQMAIYFRVTCKTTSTCQVVGHDGLVWSIAGLRFGTNPSAVPRWLRLHQRRWPSHYRGVWCRRVGTTPRPRIWENRWI